MNIIQTSSLKPNSLCPWGLPKNWKRKTKRWNTRNDQLTYNSNKTECLLPRPSWIFFLPQVMLSLSNLYYFPALEWRKPKWSDNGNLENNNSSDNYRQGTRLTFHSELKHNQRFRQWSKTIKVNWEKVLYKLRKEETFHQYEGREIAYFSRALELVSSSPQWLREHLTWGIFVAYTLQGKVEYVNK